MLGHSTRLLAVILLHALQAVQQVVHFAFDLAQLPFDGLQLVHFHCREATKNECWKLLNDTRTHLEIGFSCILSFETLKRS